jgi:ankyrin repeat protein
MTSGCCSSLCDSINCHGIGLDCMKCLLEHNANINQTDNYARTPLYIAAKNGHPKGMRLLLEHKANINQTDNYARTPLYIASWYGHLDCVRLLLEHKATINQCNSGRTPLYIASKNGNTDCMRLLLEYKANISQSDLKARTPFQIAIAYKRFDAADVLLKHFAQPAIHQLFYNDIEVLILSYVSSKGCKFR